MASLAFVFSCQPDDPQPSPEYTIPTSYSFERNGESSVDFKGQTDRLLMFKELTSYAKDQANWPITEGILENMFANENSPFANKDLNTSTKNLRSKTAASVDYFSTNSVEQFEIIQLLYNWLSSLTEISNLGSEIATLGNAGLADSKRLVDHNGLEYVQLFEKGLMGACLMDQVLNNYLSVNKLDAGGLRSQQEELVLEDGTNYTSMEHYWDEAYGYIFGADGGYFWDSYLGQVDEDEDFAGIYNEIKTAFITGRAAIENADWEKRDAQIDIIRASLSKVCAIRAVHYLKEGKEKLAPNVDQAFHPLSEGYGFIYSLRFTQNPETNQPYFSKAEVDEMLSKLTKGTSGFWDADYLDTILLELAIQIANEFDFTVDEA
ncbi:MAG: DUF4856 domain-containing protein [Bacteroidetes bacterium]|nr:DUF4856 domain-containing protein [Bacteroidota bacterium]